MLTDKQESENKRGNCVAKAVWVWLQDQQFIQSEPWVLDERSDQQKARDELLTDLERVILEASKVNKN